MGYFRVPCYIFFFIYSTNKMGKKNRTSTSTASATNLENTVSDTQEQTTGDQAGPEEGTDTGAEQTTNATEAGAVEQADDAPQQEAAAEEAVVEQAAAAQDAPVEEAPVAQEAAAVQETPVPEVAAVAEEAPVVEQAAEVAVQAEPEAAVEVVVAEKEQTIYDQAVTQILGLLTPELRAHVENILNGDDVLAKLTLGDIIAYARNMSPTTPVTEAEGSLHQVSLFRSLVNIINTGCKDFRLFYSVFLAMVEELKVDHVFNERFINRFHPTIPLGHDDRQAFQFLVHLFLTTSDATTRSRNLTQIDLNRAVAKGLNEAGKKRLLNFYQA